MKRRLITNPITSDNMLRTGYLTYIWTCFFDCGKMAKKIFRILRLPFLSEFAEILSDVRVVSDDHTPRI